MYADDAGLVLSPTDLTKHLACPHLTTLDLQAVQGDIEPPDHADEALDLIFRLGLEHEAHYLDTLRQAGRTVVEIPDDLPLVDRVEATTVAMAGGAEVIYQATFVHDGHRGHADFLIRADRPSLLGPYSYDVADTKLARKMKVAALLQMADYGRHLERIQGQPPIWLTVVTGDGQERRFRYADTAAYANRATAKLLGAVTHPTPTAAEPVAHCAECRWAPRCQAEWRDADHLSLVAFMRSDHRRALETAGISTVEALAASDPADLPATIGLSSRVRLQAQASLQVQERHDGQPHYDLLEPAPGLGLLALPPPSPHDVYLDFEGDPYAENGEGREYLAGLLDRSGQFTAYWAHTRDEARNLTQALLADLVARKTEHPDMHIYHYASYERSALARLTQRHGVAELDFDTLLRLDSLVDLYAAVRQGLRVSKESYSIKKLEAFYWEQQRGDDDVTNALDSVVAYERWTAEADQAILDSIRDYNEQDVRSTRDLHDWLEARRAELETHHGPLDRPEPSTAPPPPELSEVEEAEASLAAQLVAAGHPLLAGLVGFYRREARPQYWDYFKTSGLSNEELVDDTGTIGMLGEPEDRGPIRKSTIWRYPFPPQETKLHRKAADADTRDAVIIHDIDVAGGWLEITVGAKRPPPARRGIGPSQPVRTAVLRDAVVDVAQAVLRGGSPIGQRLIEREVPSDLAVRAGENTTDAAVRIASTLDGTVLAIQGPPGSGKTVAGGNLIRALLDDGKRVGVTASSHAVIGNLLKAVGRPALQKCEDYQHCGDPLVERVSSNDAVRGALLSGDHNLVGGTPWLWALPDFADSIDVLVVDEAGQFSLANAVAVAGASHGLVLLGDPQQLSQPSQATHPHGAGISVLDHILDGAPTMPPERGLFLDQTYRMHPELSSVVSSLMYEGRLHSAPGRELQRVDAPPNWTGSGIRWVPVEHVGNRSASTEEAIVVERIISELLAGKWTDSDGNVADIRARDVLVVAPYNAHVSRIRARGVAPEVGTVDKFQGQQAAVVIYSMASSSAEVAPRGVSFLYDLHRLNVAVSRARCMAIVVGSPALLDAAVGDPDQLRSVNGHLMAVEFGSLAIE